MRERRVCTFEDCERPVARSDLCWLHFNRLRTGKPLNAPLRVPPGDSWLLLTEAALSHAEAAEANPNCVDKRAKDRLRKSAVAYGDSLAEAEREAYAVNGQDETGEA